MSDDKTRMDPREVLTAAIAALEQEGRHIVARPLVTRKLAAVYRAQEVDRG